MVEPLLEKQKVNEKTAQGKIIKLQKKKSNYLFEAAAETKIGSTGLHFKSNTLQKNKQYS
jgi:hypothetical protein